MSMRSADGDLVFLDERSAMELFKPLEEANGSCFRVRFGSNIFGVGAALVAKRALLNVQKTLEDVEFAHFVFGRSEDEALEVMSIFSSALQGCTLTTLTLALGELGEKGVKSFVPLLESHERLRKLEFISSNISFEAAEAIFELLPSIERIENLNFMYNQKGNDSAETLFEIVKKCIALDINFSENNKWIALEDNQFSRDNLAMWDGIDLVGPFEESSSLSMLDLESNMCRLALRQVISGYLCLTKVNITNMNLQDERVIDISHCLKNTAPYLRVLIVGGNNVTPKAAPALAECLAEKKFLTRFSAEDNKLKDDGSLIICKAISEGHQQLQVLDLSVNGMSGIGAKAAAEAVAKKPSFSCLDISQNFITVEEIATIKDLLRNCNNCPCKTNATSAILVICGKINESKVF